MRRKKLINQTSSQFKTFILYKSPCKRVKTTDMEKTFSNHIFKEGLKYRIQRTHSKFTEHTQN